jgi:hypothetical protein
MPSKVKIIGLEMSKLNTTDSIVYLRSKGIQVTEPVIAKPVINPVYLREMTKITKGATILVLMTTLGDWQRGRKESKKTLI